MATSNLDDLAAFVLSVPELKAAAKRIIDDLAEGWAMLNRIDRHMTRCAARRERRRRRGR